MSESSTLLLQTCVGTLSVAEVGVGALLLAGLDDPADHVVADVAHRGEAEPDVGPTEAKLATESFTSGGSTLMPSRRHSAR